jgi:hypothetical protein
MFEVKAAETHGPACVPHSRHWLGIHVESEAFFLVDNKKSV